jgi:predicted ATPase
LKAIYIDNFRGIEDSLIELKTVNFLVGENSTGKTSFLAAIKILGSQRFWFSPTFNDPDLHFSLFSEIVSKKSVNTNSFTLGLVGVKADGESSPRNDVRLMTFIDEEGLPSVSHYSFLSSIGLITTILKDGIFLYKINNCDDLDVKSIIEICKKEHIELNPVNYQKIEIEGLPKELFFANALKFVMADIAGKDFRSGEKITVQLEMNTTTFECKWIAPIRAKPEKIYLSNKYDYSAEGSHIPNVLKKLLGKPDRSSKILEAIKKFGAESGLFSDIKIKKFGKQEMAPFEVNVDLHGNKLSISNVGYGVSQVLPIIIESRGNKRAADYITIQQPEVHLHPRAQAALGEYIFNSAKETGNKFIIETHSDYLIDRLRICVSESDDKIEAQVIFFERCEGKNKVTPLSIDQSGSYPMEQPRNFREFFLKEEIKLLRL